MLKVPARSHLRTDGAHAATNVRRSGKAPSLTALCQALGPVVYFLRTAEGSIKIGFTDGYLDGRKRARKADWSDILALTPGSLESEAAWHERFASYALGHELFRPAPAVMGAINQIRASYGLPPVDVNAG